MLKSSSNIVCVNIFFLYALTNQILSYASQIQEFICYTKLIDLKVYGDMPKQEIGKKIRNAHITI